MTRGWSGSFRGLTAFLFAGALFTGAAVAAMAQAAQSFNGQLSNFALGGAPALASPARASPAGRAVPAMPPVVGRLAAATTVRVVCMPLARCMPTGQ